MDAFTRWKQKYFPSLSGKTGGYLQTTGESAMLRIVAKASCLVAVLMISFTPFGNADKSNETRIYETDSIGTINSNKPSLVIQKDGRILPTDSIGTRDSSNPNQYRIIGDRIYETDSLGTIKQDKSRKTK